MLKLQTYRFISYNLKTVARTDPNSILQLTSLSEKVHTTGIVPVTSITFVALFLCIRRLHLFHINFLYTFYMMDISMPE
jgi:hypothetical protein